MVKACIVVGFQVVAVVVVLGSFVVVATAAIFLPAALVLGFVILFAVVVLDIVIDWVEKVKVGIVVEGVPVEF